jgi:hypothetical protein
MSRKKGKPPASVVAARAHDGFNNLVQKSGIVPGMNSVSAGQYNLTSLLSRNRIKLEAMYRQNWITGSMVDSVAEDMTRAGMDLSGDVDPVQIEGVQAAFDELKIWDALLDTIKWARLYGGAVAIIQIEGQDLTSPLRVETIGLGQFQGLAVYDRWMVQPDLARMIPSGPDIGLPMYYRVVSDYDATSQTYAYGQSIHYTRLIRQIGIKLPPYQAMTEEYWGESVLERLEDRLISFDTATMGAANLIDKAHLRMIGIDGLRDILAAGGPAEENLVKMFSYVRQMQTNEGITLLDKNDTWATGTYTFAGLADMMLQFGQQLSGATQIPLVRLFGMSPAGLNATGESDLRTYYDGIGTKQESNLRTGVLTLINIVFRSLYGIDAPKSLKMKFAPLWQTSDTERATNAKTVTETIVGAHEAGLVSTAVAMKELRQQSDDTGIFGNISDEDIQAAELEPPPSAPTEAVAPATPNPLEAPAVESKPTVTQRLLAWVKGQ